MFSGGSMLSNRAQSRKKRQGMSSYNWTLAWSDCPEEKSYLEPNDHQVPKADHHELEWRVASPSSDSGDSLGVLYRYYIQVVQHHFHRQKTCNESNSVVYDSTSVDLWRCENLAYKSDRKERLHRRIYLRDEIRIRDDWASNVQWRIEQVGKVCGDIVWNGISSGFT